MEEVKSKHFKNGSVYLLKNQNGRVLETTDTFLPMYTIDAKSRKTNALTGDDLGSRAERWMVGVSVMSGCPVRCKFCATGKMKAAKAISAEDIYQQIQFVIDKNNIDPSEAREFKINYTRMGEPFLNIKAVRECIDKINTIGIKNVHHYISTVGIKNSDFSWIEGNISLQLSLHSTDNTRRNYLIPYANKMSIEELGTIRTNSNRKTTINMTLVDDYDFDIDVLRRYFDPKYFFVKVSPLNKNIISERNLCGEGVIKQTNLQ